MSGYCSWATLCFRAALLQRVCTELDKRTNKSSIIACPLISDSCGVWASWSTACLISRANSNNSSAVTTDGPSFRSFKICRASMAGVPNNSFKSCQASEKGDLEPEVTWGLTAALALWEVNFNKKLTSCFSHLKWRLTLTSNSASNSFQSRGLSPNIMQSIDGGMSFSAIASLMSNVKEPGDTWGSGVAPDIDSFIEVSLAVSARGSCSLASLMSFS